MSDYSAGVWPLGTNPNIGKVHVRVPPEIREKVEMLRWCEASTSSLARYSRWNTIGKSWCVDLIRIIGQFSNYNFYERKRRTDSLDTLRKKLLSAYEKEFLWSVNTKHKLRLYRTFIYIFFTLSNMCSGICCEIRSQFSRRVVSVYCFWR